MNVLGRIAVGLFMAVLAVAILLFSLGSVSYLTVLEPSFFKSRLEASGIYQEMGATQAQLLFVDVDQTDPQIAAEIDRVTPYFEQVLDPDLVRSLSATIIESVDDWLNGHTPTPEFVVDTKTIRDDLNTALADYMKARVADLPPCDSVSLDYDLLTAECRPSFDITDSEYLAYADDLTSDLPLLDRDQLTNATAIEDPNHTAWNTIPRTYWAGKITLVVFAVALLLLTGTILITSANRRRVFARVGGIATFTSVILFVGAGVSGLWIGNAGFDSLHAQTPMEQGFADSILLPIVHSLAKGVGIWMAIFGSIWATVAIACFVAARSLKRKSRSGEAPFDQTAIIRV